MPSAPAELGEQWRLNSLPSSSESDNKILVDEDVDLPPRRFSSATESSDGSTDVSDDDESFIMPYTEQDIQLPPHPKRIKWSDDVSGDEEALVSSKLIPGGRLGKHFWYLEDVPEGSSFRNFITSNKGARMRKRKKQKKKKKQKQKRNDQQKLVVDSSVNESDGVEGSTDASGMTITPDDCVQDMLHKNAEPEPHSSNGRGSFGADDGEESDAQSEGSGWGASRKLIGSEDASEELPGGAIEIEDGARIEECISELGKDELNEEDVPTILSRFYSGGEQSDTEKAEHMRILQACEDFDDNISKDEGDGIDDETDMDVNTGNKQERDSDDDETDIDGMDTEYEQDDDSDGDEKDELDDKELAPGQQIEQSIQNIGGLQKEKLVEAMMNDILKNMRAIERRKREESQQKLTAQKQEEDESSQVPSASNPLVETKSLKDDDPPATFGSWENFDNSYTAFNFEEESENETPEDRNVADDGSNDEGDDDVSFMNLLTNESVDDFVRAQAVEWMDDAKNDDDDDEDDFAIDFESLFGKTSARDVELGSTSDVGRDQGQETVPGSNSLVLNHSFLGASREPPSHINIDRNQQKKKNISRKGSVPSRRTRNVAKVGSNRQISGTKTSRAKKKKKKSFAKRIFKLSLQGEVDETNRRITERRMKVERKFSSSENSSGSASNLGAPVHIRENRSSINRNIGDDISRRSRVSSGAGPITTSRSSSAGGRAHVRNIPSRGRGRGQRTHLRSNPSKGMQSSELQSSTIRHQRQRPGVVNSRSGEPHGGGRGTGRGGVGRANRSRSVQEGSNPRQRESGTSNIRAGNARSSRSNQTKPVAGMGSAVVSAQRRPPQGQVPSTDAGSSKNHPQKQRRKAPGVATATSNVSHRTTKNNTAASTVDNAVADGQNKEDKKKKKKLFKLNLKQELVDEQ